MSRFSTATWVGLISGLAHANDGLILPAVLSDHMVLQREADVAIWGTAPPGQVVSVTAEWHPPARQQAKADPNGRWRVTVRTPRAGGPYAVTVRAGSIERRIADVLIGEVWLCSGQSNMEWPLGAVNGAEEEKRAADRPRVRLLQVPNRMSPEPRDDCASTWQVCTPDTAAGFSAVGYFFARRIEEGLDVPVGVISADWGGTRIEAWMSERMLAPFEGQRATLAALRAQRDPAERERRRERQESAWWTRAEEQAGRVWIKPDFDDSGWKPLVQPGAWVVDGLDRFDGLLLCRRSFDLPASASGASATLELGPIDDRDETWVNGVRVGAMRGSGAWATPRRYNVPPGVLRSGRNVVSVLVLDTGGEGGLTGDASAAALRVNGASAPVPLAGEWRYERGPAMAALAPLPTSFDHPNAPTVLYNGMIAPLLAFRIRGVLWYQGESNRGNASEYAELFPAMIRGWREDWGLGELPFYYVQIAPFAYGDDHGQSALLREAQRRALAVPGTGMVVTTDIGDVRDIHPRNKQEVGRRLALWALARTYDRPAGEFSGPLYREMTVEGARARVRFDHADGLQARGGALTHFEIAGADRRFVEADAEIDGPTVLVWSPGVPQPVAVRFGWSTTAEPNLFNAAGLPASPFRTDDWE